MKFPFTAEQFLEVFKNYNQFIYPMQFIFYLIAAAVVFLVVTKSANADRIINIMLTFFWLWMGIVYHLFYFTQINKAAYLFGSIFILQGLLFFYYGVLNNKLSYKFHADKFGWTGALLIIFALIIYPIISFLAVHAYPASPTFGLPCPTTIFTFGILLCFDKKLPHAILIIPLLWSVIGFFAALKLGMYEDTGLLVAGISALIMIVLRNRNLNFFIAGRV